MASDPRAGWPVTARDGTRYVIVRAPFWLARILDDGSLGPIVGYWQADIDGESIVNAAPRRPAPARDRRYRQEPLL